MKKTLTVLTFIFFTIILVSIVNAQDKIGLNQKKIEKAEYDQNVVIKKKLRVEIGRFCKQSSGVTRLRVTFDKSE